jgi:hypothetical protein
VSRSSNLGADLKAILEKVVADVTNQAHSVMLDVELEGISSMRQHIDESETDWGRSRQGGWASGPAGPGARPSAGRRETDEMYNKVIGWTDWDEPTRIVTTWGWENPEAYYLYQEHGTDKIRGMEALHYSLHAVIPLMDSRLKRIKA